MQRKKGLEWVWRGLGTRGGQAGYPCPPAYIGTINWKAVPRPVAEVQLRDTGPTGDLGNGAPDMWAQEAQPS